MEFHPRRLKEGIVDISYNCSGRATQKYHTLAISYSGTRSVLFMDDMQEERGEEQEKAPKEILLSILRSKIEQHGYALQALSHHQAVIKKKSENLEEKL